jgi:hypothetical protein
MKSSAIRVLATLALAAVPGFASPILVSNFSFEQVTGGVSLPTVCGANCGVSNGNTLAILGWTFTGNSSAPWGQFQPGAATIGFFNVGPNPDNAGPTIAYVQGGTLSQVAYTIPVLTANLSYTLQVDIGDRKDLGVGTFVGTADLKICAVSTCTTTAAMGTAPGLGGFSTYTATYLATAADSGKTITIELNGIGAQGDFDNVRLTDGVPEPASFLLIGSALFALSAIRRCRVNS